MANPISSPREITNQTAHLSLSSPSLDKKLETDLFQVFGSPSPFRSDTPSDISLAKDSSDSERLWTPTPARQNTPISSESEQEDFSSPLQQAQDKTAHKGKETLLGAISDQGVNDPEIPLVSESLKIRQTIQETAEASGVSLTEEEITLMAQAFDAFTESSSKEEIQKLIENTTWIDCGDKKVWKLNKRLGNGKQGDVIFGITSDGQKCAIKKRHSKEELAKAKSEVEQEMRSEDSYLEKLQGVDGVIKLLAKNSDYLILEYCPSNLAKAISEIYTYVLDEGGETETCTGADWETLDKLTQQICETLSKIHESGVIHSDLKNDNILIDQERNIKILDFGSSGLVEEQTYGCSMGFMPPEQVETCHRMTQKADVWSTMLILLDLNWGILDKSFKEAAHAYKKMTTGFINGAASRCGDDTDAVTRDYRMQADHQFKTWQQEGRTGLLTHLQPTNALEKTLIDMSSFKPETRISSADIQKEIEELAKQDQKSLYTDF